MLRRLRWQLSFLYVLAAAALISLIGGGAYSLLSYYFKSSTDLALQYKVAQDLTRNGQPLPYDLGKAQESWESSHLIPTAPPELSPTPTITPTPTPTQTPTFTPTPSPIPTRITMLEDDDHENESDSDHDYQYDAGVEDSESSTASEGQTSAEEDARPNSEGEIRISPEGGEEFGTPEPGEGSEQTPEGEVEESVPHNEAMEEYYDSELASIFLLTADTEGQVISGPDTYNLTFKPDPEAIQAALSAGSDFRTITQDDGSRIRLFTYQASIGGERIVIQAGRSLQDQDRVLGQLLAGLAVMGGLSVVLVGFGSWWLAGRSLIPAQGAWDRQQDFIANASHELRAPLTLLRASAEVALRDVKESSPQGELLGDILTETDHMKELVEDLLLLSRLDAGKLDLQRELVDLSDMLPDLGREMSRVAVERGVAMEVGSVQGKAVADPTRLRQVLLITLDNALRHTPSGGVIQLTVRESGGDVIIQVSDTGSGIPEQHLAHVFERFYRGERDRSQDSRGSGLGLSIARGLVEAMGGSIELQSQTGQGTQVTIHLPTA
ncbi:MAG: sensor histidine kinase [Anaerolineales bacterium]